MSTDCLINNLQHYHRIAFQKMDINYFNDLRRDSFSNLRWIYLATYVGYINHFNDLRRDSFSNLRWIY
jgi:hypothetical protein